MDNGDDIGGFLVSRRARITPQQAGLPVYGPRPAAPAGTPAHDNLQLLAGWAATHLPGDASALSMGCSIAKC